MELDMTISNQEHAAVSAVSKSDIDIRVDRSVKVYDTSFLNGYDVFVHGFCNKYAWKCSTDILINQYKSLVSKNHLEAGIGTGFLIDKMDLGHQHQRLGILDFSHNCLKYSEKRLSRYRPEIFYHDILKPIDSTAEKFESVGINYVLHCVPGSFENKGVAFGHLKSLLKPNGTLFGSTLLGADVPRNVTARVLMSTYNRLGVFSNKQDTAQSLRTALSVHFDHVDIDIVGCCALFEVR
jgi:ubiquinone/menaquinone biosynthesis C-methylase UbiE